MERVSIVGSGNVGANTAFFIAERGITDILLYDLKEGLSTGKALDLTEAAPIRKYRNSIRGTDCIEDVAGSEVVVLAAGKVRTPGMKREELFRENRELAATLAPEIARLAPEAKVIVTTEPVDMITAEFAAVSGLPHSRILGIGGCLDATRLRFSLSRELGISPENITATVIGRHSDDMIVLPRYCSVAGIPLPEILSAERIEALAEETRQAGDLIVRMAQRSSAFYAPSAAVADVVDSIHMNLRRILCVSVMLDGQYGVKGVAMSLPSVIGWEGIARVLTPQLTAEERRRFEASASALAAILEQGGSG